MSESDSSRLPLGAAGATESMVIGSAFPGGDGYRAVREAQGVEPLGFRVSGVPRLAIVCHPFELRSTATREPHDVVRHTRAPTVLESTREGPSHVGETHRHGIHDARSSCASVNSGTGDAGGRESDAGRRGPGSVGVGWAPDAP